MAGRRTVRWRASLAATSAIVLLLAFGLAGCAPTLSDCYARDLIFTENADDESVAELSLVDCVSGNVFAENTLISELELPFLTDVGGSFVISQNLVLAHIDLPLLTSVGGLFEVSANSVLEDISLPALESVGDDLVVTDNPELPVAEVAAALEDVEVSGERVFE